MRSVACMHTYSKLADSFALFCDCLHNATLAHSLLASILFKAAAYMYIICKEFKPSRSQTSSSHHVLKPVLKWTYADLQAESGLFARNRQLAMSPAAPSCPTRGTAQGRTRQHAASPSPAVNFQQQPNKKQDMLPGSGHSPHVMPAPEACLPSHNRPLQPMQQPAPVHQGNGVRISEQAELGRGHGDAGMASRGPHMGYCLSSAQPAVGAGLWEEQTTRYASCPMPS